MKNIEFMQNNVNVSKNPLINIIIFHQSNII